MVSSYSAVPELAVAFLDIAGGMGRHVTPRKEYMMSDPTIKQPTLPEILEYLNEDGGYDLR